MAASRSRRKSSIVSELRVDSVVATLATADRVRAAHVIRCGIEAIVLAFAVGLADRMNGREIQNIESHIAYHGQPANDIAESAVPLRGFRSRPRKQLIPGAERGLRTLNVEQEHWLVAIVKMLLGVAHHFTQIGTEQDIDARFGWGVVEPIQRRSYDMTFSVMQMPLCLVQNFPALGDLNADVGASRTFQIEVAAKGPELVPPGRDGEFVGADTVRQDRRLPTIVAKRLHRQILPILIVDSAPHEVDGEQLMPIGEHVCLYSDALSYNPFCSKSAAVHRWRDVVDHNARCRRQFRWLYFYPAARA